MADLSRLNFDTNVNYMKRSSLSGQIIIILGSVGSTTTYTIAHNLGYIPIIHVSYDASNNGIIWSGDKANLYNNSSLSGSSSPADPTLTYWVDTTTLTINLINDTSPTASGSRTIYWIIYLDYGNI